LTEGTITEKTIKCLQNLQAILSAAGTSLEKVVKVTVFLTSMDNLAAMNQGNEQVIQHKPARSCVAVKELEKGVPVEIECIAML
jgi:2-iminobutanoate/2-iminopropanoate deaminase